MRRPLAGVPRLVPSRLVLAPAGGRAVGWESSTYHSGTSNSGRVWWLLRRRFSSGTLSAALLILPVGIWSYYGAYLDGALGLYG